MSGCSETKAVIHLAFRSLLKEQPFSKISVSDICQKCDINRKSFYYHYRDKYDMINSIFDCEFRSYYTRDNGNDSAKEALRSLCSYLYDNRVYYRKILTIEGQNSFSEYLTERICIYLKSCSFDKDDFYIRFVSDAIVCSIKEWLLSRSPMSCENFYKNLWFCLTKHS